MNAGHNFDSCQVNDFEGGVVGLGEGPLKGGKS